MAKHCTIHVCLSQSETCNRGDVTSPLLHLLDHCHQTHISISQYECVFYQSQQQQQQQQQHKSTSFEEGYEHTLIARTLVAMYLLGAQQDQAVRVFVFDIAIVLSSDSHEQQQDTYRSKNKYIRSLLKPKLYTLILYYGNVPWAKSHQQMRQSDEFGDHVNVHVCHS